MKRTRKIIATFFLFFFVVFYSLLVMVLAVKTLPDTHAIIQLIFYVFFGLFWVLPAGLIIWLGWRGDKAITPKRI